MVNLSPSPHEPKTLKDLLGIYEMIIIVLQLTKEDEALDYYLRQVISWYYLIYGRGTSTSEQRT